MATKDSEYPDANLPLAGTETAVIVQDGYNRKAPVSAIGGQSDSDWIVPTFTNSWVNYGSTHAVVGFRRHKGFVILKGLMKSGTLGVPAFVLPEGYRPAEQLLFPTISNALIGRIDIFANGDVVPSQSTNAWVTLSHISFFIDS